MSRAKLALWLLRLFALMPLWLSQALGAGVGWLFGLIPSSLRRVAAINIGLCLPELSPAAQRRLVRRSLRELGKAMMELGALWLWPTQRLLPLVREVRGEALLQRAVAEGKGVILAAPHLGAWELAGIYISTRWPLTSLYRPSRLAEFDGHMRAARQRAGATLVPTDAGGVRALFKALGRNESVGILPDQEPAREAGVFAPFFGVQTNTMVLLPRLVQRSGAPVLFVFAERLAWGRGYILHFKPAPAGMDDGDLAVAAAALNLGVEACVREVPAQYQWVYKRFKSRPPGEEKVY
jgi:KDO2-lipid IV(A) lauroyltransferase